MGPGEPDMEFDHHGNNPRKIREAHKSYIDAILLELVLPDSRYPPYVLMACLHDAVEECRREEKRFTQALWDSVGDLSVKSHRPFLLRLVPCSPSIRSLFKC